MRSVTLFTGQWADLPIEQLAGACAEWGFDGLELACWGDHFDVERAIAEPGYPGQRRSLLERHGLGCWAIGAHLVGQAVCDPIDERHRSVLPPSVWGDGDPEGVRGRAAERMKDTARAAGALGVPVVTGFTGSPIWHLLYSFPPNDWAEIERGYEEFAERWAPIIDVFEAEGVRFALEVHPTEIAYDFVTTRRALEAIGDRRGFGINLDPSHFIPQFLDPAAFALEFAERICACAHQGRQAPSGRAPVDPRLASGLRRRRAGMGRSSRPGTATWTSTRSCARSTGSDTTVRCRSSGRTAAWSANGAHARRSRSCAKRTSRPPNRRSTQRSARDRDEPGDRCGDARLRVHGQGPRERLPHAFVHDLAAADATGARLDRGAQSGRRRRGGPALRVRARRERLARARRRRDASDCSTTRDQTTFMASRLSPPRWLASTWCARSRSGATPTRRTASGSG